MRTSVSDHLNHVLKHLYINPLEKCNLHCAICYTKKTDPILTEEEILSFIHTYQSSLPLESITFCGGEVFTLHYFPHLVNTLTQKGIFLQIITNGTVDKLDDLSHPNLVNLIVSIDGLKDYHEKNRGKGNFDTSMKFLKKAHDQGFHTEIFSILTRQNISDIQTFETYLHDRLRHDIQVTYHPRKPPTYLMHHPLSNIVGETSGFEFLSHDEMIHVMKTYRTFPPKDLGCYQIALVSDGRVFGCCEGVTPIGRITDPIPKLVDQMKKRLTMWEKQHNLKHCLGCTQSEFMCGIKDYLSIIYAD